MDDIAGLKVRVVQSPTYLDTWTALGCQCRADADHRGLYGDGAEDDRRPRLFTVIEANKFYEVQKYLAVTNHMYNPQAFFMSKKAWDKLNADG